MGEIVSGDDNDRQPQIYEGQIMEKRPDKWEIELKLPKGKIKTFVYSHDGNNIIDRFAPKYECRVIGVMDEEKDTKKSESEKLQDQLEPIDEG